MGTIDPVGDFRSLIGQKDVDRFDEGEPLPQPPLCLHPVYIITNAKGRNAFNVKSFFYVDT